MRLGPIGIVVDRAMLFAVLVQHGMFQGYGYTEVVLSQKSGCGKRGMGARSSRYDLLEPRF
jgi:hypothetical protein